MRVLSVLINKNGRVSVPKTVVLALIAPPLIFILAAFVLSLTDIRLKKYNPSWIILDRNYSFIAEIESPDGEIGYWPAPDTLPRTLVTAALAAEDRRFRQHIGVDIKSAARAFVNNYIKKKNFSGASTIAMQTARLQRGGGSNIFSKVRDSFAAVWLTVIYGRDRVLRQYISISPYGNRIAGAPCASRRYFRKPVQDLSLAESALLVSVPRAPGRMNLFSHHGFLAARSRARLIMGRCLEYGWIDSTEYKQSMAELATFSIPPRDIREEGAIHAIIRYKNLLHGDKNINAKGLVVSTIDMNIQRSAQNALTSYLKNIKGSDVENGAVIVIDKNNHQVLAYVGSGGYFSSYNGMHDYAAVKRSTGSLLKPFIFAFGMEELGYTAATVLRDVNHDFGEGARSFIPANSDRDFFGPVLYKYALANSRNVPAVHVLKELGVNSVYKRLGDLKLAPDDGRGDYYGLGLSIGGLYCGLSSICRAYLTLGNEGRISDLVWFMDDTVRQHSQVITQHSAMMMQRFLADPLARLPTFPRNGFFEYPFPVAVKTGTSDSFRDSWCVAWSSRYLIGVWLGNANNHPTKRVSGYTGAAPLVKMIMMRLHPQERDGSQGGAFPPPPGWQPFPICRLTGLLADVNTPYVTSEFFAPGTEPKEASNVLRVLPVDTRNGLLANMSCPERYREYRSFLSFPLEYESWARSQGLPVAPRLQSPYCPGERLSDSHKIEITWPRSGARFFIDPEMPPEQAFLSVNAAAEPEAESLLWFVNGEEHTMTSPPHTIRLPMQSGKYELQAAIPGTPVRSRAVRVEIQ
ncbi:MAG: transglycosylase domain-containing protein [Chitinispirillia bacterium]|nr:transglycosylase domain-containing protein [Chitinispirillia bacterium]MCL2268558.1 transglycosylase domain-containing protein [Chitinispirillia bacterium]